MTIILAIVSALNILAFLDSVFKYTALYRERVKESEPDGFWYFGYLESLSVQDGRKILTFKDGKVISIPEEHKFGQDVENGELLRIYYGCPHVVKQIENLN